MKTVGKNKNRVKKPAFVSMKPNPAHGTEERMGEAAQNMVGYFQELLGSDDPKQLETWRRVAHKLGVEVVTFDDPNQCEGMLEREPNPLLHLNVAFPLEKQLRVIVNLLSRYLMGTWGYMNEVPPTKPKPSMAKKREVLNPKSRAYKRLEAQVKEIGKRPRATESPEPPTPTGEGWISVPVAPLIKLMRDACACWRHRDGFHVACTVEECPVAPGWPVRHRTRLSMSSLDTSRSFRLERNAEEPRHRATNEEVTRVLADFGEGWHEDDAPTWGITRQFLRWQSTEEVE